MCLLRNGGHFSRTKCVLISEFMYWYIEHHLFISGILCKNYFQVPAVSATEFAYTNKSTSHFDQIHTMNRLNRQHSSNLAQVNPSGYLATANDDVIKWKHFPRFWPFKWRNHRSPVNSPHKGYWRGAYRFSLICAWINSWGNNRHAGDLGRHRAHYDVTLMHFLDTNEYHADTIHSSFPRSVCISINSYECPVCYPWCHCFSN